MRDAVKRALVGYQTQYEGCVFWLYGDEENLVTTAIGKLIDLSSLKTKTDPWAPALSLPWKHNDLTTPATHDEIVAEWKLVKSHSEMTHLGGGAYRAITFLRLTDADVNEITFNTAYMFETILKKRFTAYDSWPADAQLGLLSIAWAAGPACYKTFPKFSAAADARDFDTCAKESALNGVWYQARNEASALCFTNAAVVERQAWDPEKLWWPAGATM
jgi:hypothetical protein